MRLELGNIGSMIGKVVYKSWSGLVGKDMTINCCVEVGDGIKLVLF